MAEFHQIVSKVRVFFFGKIIEGSKICRPHLTMIGKTQILAKLFELVFLHDSKKKVGIVKTPMYVLWFFGLK